MTDLVVTLIGPDQPGIIDSVAEVVAAQGGNWLESRMAHLAGKFAGVLRVEIDDAGAERLASALVTLSTGGLRVVVERSESSTTEPQRSMEIDLLGVDRPGIVHEIATLLASRRINVEELVTDRQAAANSGDRMFHARIHVVLPDSVELGALRQGLEQLAGDMMVEIHVAEAIGAGR